MERLLFPNIHVAILPKGNSKEIPDAPLDLPGNRKPLKEQIMPTMVFARSASGKIVGKLHFWNCF